MKTLNLTILIVLLQFMYNGVYAQSNKAVANKLKTVTVYEQKTDKGKLEKSQMESFTVYDKNGNVIEEIQYKLGKIDSHFVYKYDSANHKTEESELDPSGKTIKTVRYTYNNNLKTEKTVYDGSNHLLSKKTYTYETY